MVVARDRGLRQPDSRHRLGRRLPLWQMSPDIGNGSPSVVSRWQMGPPSPRKAAVGACYAIPYWPMRLSHNGFDRLATSPTARASERCRRL